MLKRVLETKRKALLILPFVSVAKEKMHYLQVIVINIVTTDPERNSNRHVVIDIKLIVIYLSTFPLILNNVECV